MKLRDLFGELVIDVCDQKKGHIFYDQIIWSLAIRTDHVRSNVAELTWQNSDQTKWSQIRISPVQFGDLHGPSPTIRHISIFFPVNFDQLYGPGPTFQPFYFWTVAFLAQEIQFSFLFQKRVWVPLVKFYKLGPSCEGRFQLEGPTHQGHIIQISIFQ